MKRLLLTLCMLIYFIVNGYPQNVYHAIIKDNDTKELLVGVNVIVKDTLLGASSDINGKITLSNIPSGKQTLVVSLIGYEKTELTYIFPLINPDEIIEILLEQSEHELEVIYVSTTRTSRHIENVPTRIEVITSEEVEEKTNMEPANVVMLLNESTGIQVQQTSATSGNRSVRIQGLDGRYTQLLKDGFPNYSGFSGGLSIMQLSPLDLQQVEFIKGPASTLYGADAIAGVINFVTKQPTKTPEWSLLMNGESFGGYDFGSFYAKRDEKIGITFLAASSYKNAYDVNNDDFTEIPETRNYTFSPTLWYYFKNDITLKVGLSTFHENRMGGDVTAINNKQDTLHAYVENNVSDRNTTQLQLEKTSKQGNTFVIKNCFNHFKRKLEIPNYTFEGIQFSSFSSASYLLKKEKHDFIVGLDFISDDFKENKSFTISPRDYSYYTTGLFLQDTWDINKKLSVEAGLRTDLQNKFGVFVLPRLSALYHLSNKLSVRAGGGLGYKAPTIFTEETEKLAYKDVQSLSSDINAETSQGGVFDINYKTVLFKKVFFSINQVFYLTHLENPLALYKDTLNNLMYKNDENGILSKGFETSIRFVYNPVKFFVGYTYIDAKTENDNAPLVLTPNHKVGFTLMIEEHHNYRIGLEAYYNSFQYRSDNTKTPDYWNMCFAVQKYFGNFSIFVNFENLTNTRQDKYEQVVFGQHNSPEFKEIWTHTEGFYTNGGIRLTF